MLRHLFLSLVLIPSLGTLPLLGDEAALRHDVETLAGDPLEGRLTGTPGARAAAAYLVEQLEALDVALGDQRTNPETWTEDSVAFTSNVTVHVGLAIFLPFDFDYNLPR